MGFGRILQNGLNGSWKLLKTSDQFRQNEKRKSLEAAGVSRNLWGHLLLQHKMMISKIKWMEIYSLILWHCSFNILQILVWVLKTGIG